jgi:hypothetical protein
MSAHPANALDAIALQLVMALERYAQDTGRMIASWPDLELYRSVSDQIETIRMYAAALPDARVQWVELLIAHSELVHLLWRVQYGQGKAMADTLEARLHHTDALAAMRNRCLRVVAASHHRQDMP